MDTIIHEQAQGIFVSVAIILLVAGNIINALNILRLHQRVEYLESKLSPSE